MNSSYNFTNLIGDPDTAHKEEEFDYYAQPRLAEYEISESPSKQPGIEAILFSGRYQRFDKT